MWGQNAGMVVDKIGDRINYVGDKMFAKVEADKSRRWQERLARYKYTYGVEDLKRAGLNPVLAAGLPSSSAVSATAAQSPNTPRSGANISNFISSAKQMKMAESELRLMKEQAQYWRNMSEKTRQETSGTAINNYIQSLSIPGLETRAGFESSQAGKAAYIADMMASGTPAQTAAKIGAAGPLVIADLASGKGVRKYTKFTVPTIYSDMATRRSPITPTPAETRRMKRLEKRRQRNERRQRTGARGTSRGK